MATFKCNEIYRASRARPVYDGLLHTRQATLLIPSGTLIGSGDTIRFFRVAPNKIIPTRILVDIDGNLDGHATPASRTLAGTMGYLRSSDRSGTNLSFAASGSAMTEDADYLLIAASVPALDPGTVDEFGTAGDGAILGNGGMHIYNHGYGSAVVGLATTVSDSEGYDGNVADVAITTTAASSTATTADIQVRVTLEFLAVSADALSYKPYLYLDRYTSAGVGTF
jgi:hypothetical protein